MTRSDRLDLLDPLDVARLGGIEVITEGVVEGFLTGMHRSPRRGFSVEFAEHRMYQPGDELRYVDWKILGRNDRLYVKQFEEETNLRAMVVWDTSRSLALKALRFLRHRGHQVLVLHIMDPAEVSLGGPNEARFEDPETHATVVVRPRDWVRPYRDTVRAVVSEWRLACRRHGIAYHQVTTDTPFGGVLREALASPSRSA